MKNKYINLFMLVLFTTIIIGITTAEAAPSVSIIPASQNVKQNDAFVIGIYLDPAGGNVSSGEIGLSFDATAFQVTSRTKGDIFGSDALDTGSAYNNTAGTVTAVLARVGLTPDPSLAGYWANVTFKVNSNAASGKYFINITSTGLADKDFNDITGVVSNNGTVVIIGAPKIISFAPSTTVNDTAPATRTFSITVDQNVNVTWQFNGENSKSETSVTESSNTITTSNIGVHNVTAIVENDNGAAMQTWIWDVKKAPSVSIIPSSQNVKQNDTFVIGIYLDPAGGSVSSGEIGLSFDATALQVASLTKGDIFGSDALDTGSKYNNTAGTVTAVLARVGLTPDPSPAGYWANVTFKVNSNAVDGNYFINITSIGLADKDFEDIIGAISNNGSVVVVSAPAVTPAPSITGFGPSSPVSDTAGASRTFNITVNQTVKVTWYINGTEVFNQTGVTESTYTNTSAAVGIWNVTAVASNANGTAMQKWDWSVVSLITDTEKPVIVSIVLSKYKVNASENIIVTVAATDNVGVEKVSADSVSLSLVSGTKQSGTWTGAITAPNTPGTYNVTVNASDAAGNKATNNTVQYTVEDKVHGVNLTVDATAKITTPKVNAIYNIAVKNTGNVADNYTLSIAANPEGATIAALNAYTINNLAAGATTTVWLNVTNGTEGIGRFRVNVTVNSSGDISKIAFVNTTTIVDGTPPVINLISRQPADDSIVNTSTTTISVNYNDTLSGINTSAVTMKLNNNPVNAIATTSGVSYTAALADGTYTVQVNVTDRAGNMDPTNWTFRVDTTGPTFLINLSMNFTANIANFVVNASEVLKTFDVNVTQDSNPRFVNKSTTDNVNWTGNFSIAVGGNYTIKVTGTDFANNTGTKRLDSSVSVMSTTANNSTTVSQTPANISMDITTSTDVLNASIAVTKTGNDTTGMLPGGNNISAGIFIIIDAADALKNNFTSGNLTVFYDVNAVSAAGITESDLKIYLFNDSTQTWEALNSSVNTTAHSVTARLPHLSTFGVFGPDLTPPVVTYPKTTPSPVPADGKTNTTLSVNVTDKNDIGSVTVDLSPIFGLNVRSMTLVSGNMYAVDTSVPINVMEGIYNLTVNATDIFNNSNTSVNISLVVIQPPPNITAFSVNSSGRLGTTFDANVTLKNEGGFDTNNSVIVVSGRHNTTGYPVYGTGAVNLKPGESTTLKVKVYVTVSADKGNYNMFADAWVEKDYPDVTKADRSRPGVTSVTP